MKYCKICKTAGKETDTVCAKGHPLSVFGAATNASTPARPPVAPPPKPEAAGQSPKPSAVMFTLLGEVQKLEETKKKNVKRGRAFALLSLAAALAIMLILYQVYSRTVLSYAVLENIRVEQDPANDWKIDFPTTSRRPARWPSTASPARNGSRSST